MALDVARESMYGRLRTNINAVYVAIQAPNVNMSISAKVKEEL